MDHLAPRSCPVNMSGSQIPLPCLLLASGQLRVSLGGRREGRRVRKRLHREKGSILVPDLCRLGMGEARVTDKELGTRGDAPSRFTGALTSFPIKQAPWQ